MTDPHSRLEQVARMVCDGTDSPCPSCSDVAREIDALYAPERDFLVHQVKALTHDRDQTYLEVLQLREAIARLRAAIDDDADTVNAQWVLAVLDAATPGEAHE
jgi:hypothetical protein